MCYFVVAELEHGEIDLPDGLRFDPCDFGLVARPGRELRCVTDGHCSCSLVRPASDVEARLRAKSARKGWSDTKIERAIAARRATEARKPGPSPALFESWLRDLVVSGATVRVFVHWADALLHAERRHRAMPLSDLGRTPIPEEGWVDFDAGG